MTPARDPKQVMAPMPKPIKWLGKIIYETSSACHEFTSEMCKGRGRESFLKKGFVGNSANEGLRTDFCESLRIHCQCPLILRHRIIGDSPRSWWLNLMPGRAQVPFRPDHAQAAKNPDFAQFKGSGYSQHLFSMPNRGTIMRSMGAGQSSVSNRNSARGEASRTTWPM